MKIAFDALPLLGRKTGIGFCESGQVSAMTKLHPENEYILQYFAVRHLETKRQELKPYLRTHVISKHRFCSPYGYRLISGFVPVPYRMFFGKEAELTHFFNYIVPPGVSGKSVVTVHDMVYKAYPETVRARTRHMLDLGLAASMKRADRIVTDSEFSRSEIIRYFPEFSEKIRVVPCGVDTERFHPVPDKKFFGKIQEKYHLPEEYFLYLGTIEPRKNLEKLILAYAEFSASVQNPAKLVLAGGKGWLYDRIFSRVQELHLQDKIQFTEYIAEEDLCILMSHALAFVFPSVYEGFGMPPLEAMACGTPVLVSNAASLPEVTGTDAVIVNPDSIPEIAQGLFRLYSDSSLRAELSRSGLMRSKEFSWEKSAELLYQVYLELLPEV